MSLNFRLKDLLVLVTRVKKKKKKDQVRSRFWGVGLRSYSPVQEATKGRHSDPVWDLGLRRYPPV